MTPGQFRRELQKDKNFDMSKMVAGQILLNFFCQKFRESMHFTEVGIVQSKSQLFEIT